MSIGCALDGFRMSSPYCLLVAIAATKFINALESIVLRQLTMQMRIPHVHGRGNPTPAVEELCRVGHILSPGRISFYRVAGRCGPNDRALI